MFPGLSPQGIWTRAIRSRTASLSVVFGSACLVSPTATSDQGLMRMFGYGPSRANSFWPFAPACPNHFRRSIRPPGASAGAGGRPALSTAVCASFSCTWGRFRVSSGGAVARGPGREPSDAHARGACGRRIRSVCLRQILRPRLCGHLRSVHGSSTWQSKQRQGLSKPFRRKRRSTQGHAHPKTQ